MDRNTIMGGTGLVLLAAVLFFGLSRSSITEQKHGRIIHETKSEFSHIRVRERDRRRSLLFVDEFGREHCQSSIDLDRPEDLQLGYTRHLFASHLFRHPQERVLILGLGGGGMVRFLEKAFPGTRVEAVEIDPAVVEIAGKYFETAPGTDFRIHVEDAFVFLERARGPFDAIYFDAFLEPAVDPDAAAMTRRLKTTEFLRGLHRQLAPGGVVAFNLIEVEESTPGYLASIREAFPQVYEFSVPGTGNLVVVATREERRASPGELEATAGKLARKYPGSTLPIRGFVRDLRDGPAGR